MGYPSFSNLLQPKDANGNPIMQPMTESLATPDQQQQVNTMFQPGTLGNQLTSQMSGPGGGAITIGPGNNNQIQGGAQAGAFQSQGQQNQSQTQVQGSTGSTSQNQLSNQTGTQNQNTTGSSTQAGTTAGQSTTSGQSTTGVNDTLGFGKLLQGQAGQAQATDTGRTAYLADLMTNGGSAFQDQVKAATNSALSGPTMQGVGDSAAARAAGYAVANVARTNQDQRLQAAGQLAGPTATQTLAAAGNPYLGTTQENTQQGSQVQQNQSSGTNAQTNTGTSTATNNTTGTGTTNNQSVSMADLLSNSSSSGASQAQNAQAAYGTTPSQTSTSSGGGGSVICTVLGEAGLLPYWMLEEELIHVRNHTKKFYNAAKGYLFWGESVARLARRFKPVAWFCLPIAKACAYEASRRARKETLKHRDQLPTFLVPLVAYHAFLLLNGLLGRFVPGKPVLHDPELRALMSRSGLELNLEGE